MGLRAARGGSFGRYLEDVHPIAFGVSFNHNL